MDIGDIVTLKEYIGRDDIVLLAKVVEKQLRTNEFIVQWYSENGKKLINSFTNARQDELYLIESANKNSNNITILEDNL